MHQGELGEGITDEVWAPKSCTVYQAGDRSSVTDVKMAFGM